jgi:hypothetical protein
MRVDTDGGVAATASRKARDTKFTAGRQTRKKLLKVIFKYDVSSISR